MLNVFATFLQGFDVSYFNSFTKCMHKTWNNVFGEEYTGDVRDVWGLIFEYIVQRIRDGYLLYQQDKQNDIVNKMETMKDIVNPDDITPAPITNSHVKGPANDRKDNNNL